MRFLCLYTPAGGRGEMGGRPDPNHRAAMMKFIDELTKAGTLETTGGLLPSVAGMRVVRSGSEITYSDGPFTETKEIVGGYAILKVKSKAEALEVSKRFLAIAGEGASEVRQIADF